MKKRKRGEKESKNREIDNKQNRFEYCLIQEKIKYGE